MELYTTFGDSVIKARGQTHGLLREITGDLMYMYFCLTWQQKSFPLLSELCLDMLVFYLEDRDLALHSL